MNAGNNYAGVYFLQKTNINLNGYEWHPIGRNGDAPFLGNYNGGNYTIKGLYIENIENSHYGLFGQVNYGNIKNVNIKESSIKLTSDYYTGGLVGVSGDSIIENCHVSAIVTGTRLVGGITGLAGTASVKDCSFIGVVQGENSVGGIVGELYNTQDGFSVENCCSNGVVKGVTDVGGIIGHINIQFKAWVKNCISYATVYAGNAGAGLIGSANNETYLSNCSVFGLVFSDGSGENKYFGGFIGHVDKSETVITNCSFVGGTNKQITTDISARTLFHPLFLTGDGVGGSLPSITNCFVYINQNSYYTDGNFLDWTIIPGINDGLPIQKALYHIAQFGESIGASWFATHGFSKV